MNRYIAAAFVCVAVFFCAPALRADSPAPATLFDPAKHMHVSEVRPGMKGYGLSVFSGSKIEKFDVEVIDVLKNFNPKHDVVLIRCHGDAMEHTGAVAGMSGSPIYLFDDTGKARMIGAFAYGWPLSKDPLAGVQPIEYMLELPTKFPPATGPSDSTAAKTGKDERAKHESTYRPKWSLDDVQIKPWGRGPAVAQSDSTANQIRLQPLATPLMAGGMNPRMLQAIAPIFKDSGMVPMQVGGGEMARSANLPLPKFEPGSVLAVPLLTGDVDLTAIGTCTEVVGDHIFGFGHPFNGEGHIDLPMGTGSIATVVANLQTSFKLGFLSKITGTLTTDQTVGVAGEIGKLPPMIPIVLHIVYADKSVDETYHFSAATHPRFTPMIAAAAVGAAMSGEKELPQYHTVDYDLTMKFANGKEIHILNTSVNSGAQEIAQDLGLPLNAALDNPFKRVDLTRLEGTVTVSNVARTAQILSVMVPRSKYLPGEVVKAFITYHPFQAEEAILPVELELPKDLPNGSYQLSVCDWQHYFEEERMADPFKFTADNADEMFQVLTDIAAVKHNAVYLRLLRQADGVAVGRTAMPRLPSSQRVLLTDSGRSDTVPFVSSTVKVVPTDLVMSGSAEFSITIDRHSKVEIAPRNIKADNAKPTQTDTDEKPVGH